MIDTVHQVVDFLSIFVAVWLGHWMGWRARQRAPESVAGMYSVYLFAAHGHPVEVAAETPEEALNAVLGRLKVGQHHYVANVRTPDGKIVGYEGLADVSSTTVH